VLLLIMIVMVIPEHFKRLAIAHGSAQVFRTATPTGRFYYCFIRSLLMPHEPVGHCMVSFLIYGLFLVVVWLF